jgi:hypothetical protein
MSGDNQRQPPSHGTSGAGPIITGWAWRNQALPKESRSYASRIIMRRRQSVGPVSFVGWSGWQFSGSCASPLTDGN